MDIQWMAPVIEYRVLSLLIGQLQWLQRCKDTFTGYSSDAYRALLQAIYRVQILQGTSSGLQRLCPVFSGVLVR